MYQPAFRLKPISAHFRDALGRRLQIAAQRRRRSNDPRRHSAAAALEQLEQRTLLSYGDIYPDLVTTVGVYDENAVQANTVDAVADGSQMTDVEFADRLATAWVNNDGGVIDGTGDGDIFGFGPDLWSVLHVASFDDTGWMLGTPPDRPAISGDGAFATIYAPSTGGYNTFTKWFGVESFEQNRNVLEIGVTVLGQNLEDYGTVYLIGHTAHNENVITSYQVLTGGTQDVFYGVTAPAADFFIGFSLGYAPEGEWIVDKPLWFDDLGVIIGDHLAAPNEPPTAVEDAYTLDENTTLTVSGSGVLANDSDPDGDPLTAVLVSEPAHGALTFDTDGSFSYMPVTGFHGSDSFTYQASDGTALSDPVTVTLNVTHVIVGPVANDDSYTVGEDETLVLPSTPTAHLTMTSEPGDYIGQGETYNLNHTTGTFTATRNFDNGVRIRYAAGPGDWWTLEFAAPGEVPLTPGVYTDATRFPFQAPDVPGLSVSGQGRGSNTLTGEFTVHEVVYGPGGEVLVFDASFEQHNEGLDPALTGHVRFVANGTGGVLANDVDADGDPLSAVLVSGPSHGSLTLNADGAPQYTPDANFHGIDTFTYRASDGTTLSDPATVTITVTPVNDAPIANDQSVTTAEDTPLSGSVTATDVDGDALQFSTENGPSHGALVLNADGTFTYTPDANFHGTDTFTFRASDGAVATDPATVTITVSAVNDAPVATDRTASTAEDTPVSDSVMATDVDGDTLQFTLESGSADGTLVLNADGTFTYTPDANFHGTDTFTYRATDGTDLSDPATVTITVDPVNDAPVANDHTASTAEDTPLSDSVTAADVDGDALQFTLADGPAHGTLVLNADGTFTYTPDADFHGTDTFTFVAADGTTASQPAAVTITVDPVNDAPVLPDATFTLAENSSVGTTVGTVVGSDVDGNPLTYQIVGGNASGAFAIDPATGVIQVADGSPLDFETTPAFALTVEAADAGGLVATAAVTVTLTDVVETLGVTIDVRPGDSSNTISSHGNGRTEVAILSTAGFDAQSVDVTTLRFGRTGTENSLRWKKGAPVHHYEDVNGDGLLDLVVQFERDLMGFYAGDTTAHLTGQTLDGTDIAGSDAVNLVGNWPS